jgi:hypothetical protein
MPQRASGPFQVTMKPATAPEEAGATTIGRMLLEKQYSGDLVGSGRGEMLTAMTSTKGSAAYAAIERVSGTLDGKSGSFVLQHAGTMNRGADQLSISIVPDSGTEQLTGIAGTLAIRMVERQHFYELDYVLP